MRWSGYWNGDLYWGQILRVFIGSAVQEDDSVHRTEHGISFYFIFERFRFCFSFDFGFDVGLCFVACFVFFWRSWYCCVCRDYLDLVQTCIMVGVVPELLVPD